MSEHYEIKILIPKELAGIFPRQTRKRFIRAGKQVLTALKGVIDAKLQRLEAQDAPGKDRKRRLRSIKVK